MTSDRHSEMTAPADLPAEEKRHLQLFTHYRTQQEPTMKLIEQIPSRVL